MLPYETNKLVWDYDVPQSIEYLVEVQDDCEICQNTIVKDWSAPFISADVPYDQLMQIMERFFGFVTTPEVMANHRNHIKTNIITDSEVHQAFMEQMKLIESDTPKKIDEKVALESLIRGLYARKQYLEKANTYGKEYAVIAQQLKQAIELKLKMKDELKEPAENKTLKDIIKYFKKDMNESNNEPTITAGRVWSRNGTKQSIEHFVRFKGYRHQIIS